MVVNQKVTGTAASMPGGLALGAVVSSLVTALGTAFAAYLISGESLPQEAIGYCAMVILLAASVTGAWTAVRRIKHRRVKVCALSGVIYYLLLVAVNILFFGGVYDGMGVTALLVLGGSGVVVLMGERRERRGHSRIKKRKHR